MLPKIALLGAVAALCAMPASAAAATYEADLAIGWPVQIIDDGHVLFHATHDATGRIVVDCETGAFTSAWGEYAANEYGGSWDTPAEIAGTVTETHAAGTVTETVLDGFEEPFVNEDGEVQEGDPIYIPGDRHTFDTSAAGMRGGLSNSTRPTVCPAAPIDPVEPEPVDPGPGTNPVTDTRTPVRSDDGATPARAAAAVLEPALPAPVSELRSDASGQISSVRGGLFVVGGMTEKCVVGPCTVFERAYLLPRLPTVGARRMGRIAVDRDTLASGQSNDARLRLTRKGSRLLRRHGSMRVEVLVTLTDALGRSQTVRKTFRARPVVRRGATAKAAQVADRDGDGNPDASDQCPDIPGGFNGCPQPPAGPTGPTRPADRDGDLLPDSLDKCPDTFARSGIDGCPPPSDRDSDGLPDASDRCPDARGTGGVMQGCPDSADRDGDQVLNMDDACPDTRGKQADGCEPQVWRIFVSAPSVKRFLSRPVWGTTYCTGKVKCKTTHAILTLSAETAKAAGIKNRRIASVSVPVPAMEMKYNISSANRKKLARLKKITLTIRAWATMADGKTLKPQQKTRTISRNLGFAQQINSLGTGDAEGI